jgi:hypothetical protein
MSLKKGLTRLMSMLPSEVWKERFIPNSQVSVNQWPFHEVNMLYHAEYFPDLCPLDKSTSSIRHIFTLVQYNVSVPVC